MNRKKIIIDPITRIEGHLRIEVELDENNVVREAWASGQLFRGIETILKGRDPRDAGLIAQRICGVCTNVHYRASISAVEDAYKTTPVENAEIIRNLTTLSLFVQDHVIHYYHLHSLDFVDVTGAIEADISKAVEVAKTFSDSPFKCSASHLEGIQEKLKKFISAGRLGLFANGYWGHEAYRLSPEENLIHMNHYFEALEIQRELGKAIAIFAGKTPHPQNLVVGGVTSVADMLNPDRLNQFMFIMKETRAFIKNAYLPDVHMVTKAYLDDMKQGAGRGLGNFFASGGYQFGKQQMLFESGVIFDHLFDALEPFDQEHITEHVNRSWYEGDEVNPYASETEPFYTDLNEDGSLKTEGKYSWVKSPRYKGKAMEVGPLARMMVGYLKGSPIIKPVMQQWMDRYKLELIDFSTTMGRTVARAIEAEICNEYIFDFISDLIENIKYYNEETWTKYQFEDLPKTSRGSGIYEVPRGVLAHFVDIKESKIANYQVIAPTTWNASPRDDTQRGPYEESMIGLKLNDPNNPLEVLRVVHSFDPCLACAVHVMDMKGKTMAEYKVNSMCSI